ncbi:hypothetical protein [Rhodococcus pyridinivorans]|uniref:hypothetical protein n=1 Tax=Rhodococcus pyridinivorans TaxID=103816 RepID=UPI002658810C|nr:hypothetical protein [Rhodococcus pyridinivorans]
MSSNWDIPSDLSTAGLKAAESIKEFLTCRGITDHGGGGRFYSPREWNDRGEQWGLGSLLIITHDGGDHAAAFNCDYGDYALMEDLREHLSKVGVYAEQCTSWYTAIYKSP